MSQRAHHHHRHDGAGIDFLYSARNPGRQDGADLQLGSRWARWLALALIFGTLALPNWSQAQSFGSSSIPAGLTNPTSLQFGPDQRLYVSEQTGTIRAYTVVRNGPSAYGVTATETINLVKFGVPNHDDDASACSALCNQRQVTGIALAGSATQPVLYVTSSDSRHAVADDSGLDTNSGVISRLTCSGGISAGVCQGWDHVDIVRGLARSEENHAINGLVIDAAANRLLVMIGGNANRGAPSSAFSGTPEYYTSAAMLSVDLAGIAAIEAANGGPFTDPRNGSKFVYDMLTLDDPTRQNINNSHSSFPYPPSHPRYAKTIDIGDPFGGNNGLNQAIIEPGSPVQIHATGFRNGYDALLTESGDLYTWDNGSNSGWGGTPYINTAAGVRKGYSTQPGVFLDAAAGDYCTNEYNESGSATVSDSLRKVEPGYYGGHPAPIRAFPGLSGIRVYVLSGSSWVQEGPTRSFADLLPAGYGLSLADFPNDPRQCEHTAASDGLEYVSASTNGLAEYTASNFDEAMRGDILAASFNGNVYRCKPDGSGGLVNLPGPPSGTANGLCEVLFGGFNSIPLDITTQGDDSPFPGTIWMTTYLGTGISIFEPVDFGVCNTSNPTGDADGDGYTNQDELDNGTNPCSAASVPPDFDGDFVSDLNDPDDDGDGIMDVVDAFALDASNGLSVSPPLFYPLFNNDPGTGLFGLGFTGLMLPKDGVTTWLELFDGEALAAGGAAGLFTVEAVTAGDALGAANTQENAFHFGVAVTTASPPFLVQTRLRPPYFGVAGNTTAPSANASYGLYVGNGDQDNYLKIALASNGAGGAGIRIVREVGGVPATNNHTSAAWAGANLLAASEIDLLLAIDPQALTAQPMISHDGGQTRYPLGPALPVPAAWLADNGEGLAIGAISTTGGGPSYAATWDSFAVDFESSTAAGTWSFVDNYDEVRHEHGFVQVGDKFYLLGGRESTAVRIYDPATGQWSSGATSPVLLHHFQAVALDGLIYVAGAMTGLCCAEPSAGNVYIYDPLQDRWSTGPSLPAERMRGGTGAAVVDGRILLFGGNEAGHYGPGSVLADAYDPRTGIFTPLADMPQPRDHYFITRHLGKLYAIGGRESDIGADGFAIDDTVAEVEVYDIASDSWTVLPASSNLPTPRAAAATGIIGNEVIVAGGEGPTLGTAHPQTEAFDLGAQTWRTLEPMRTPRHAAQAIISNSGMYVAGGSSVQGGPGGQPLDLDVFHLFGPNPPSTGSTIIPGTLSAPASLDFGVLNGGESATRTVTLNHTSGNQAMVIESLQFSGHGGFSAPGTILPVVLPPGGSVTLVLQFSPEIDGASSGTVTINHSGGSAVVALTGTGLGSNQVVLYRINVGGPALAAANGSSPNWAADTAGSPSPYRIGSGGEGIFADADGGAWGGPINMGHPSLPSSVPSAVFQSERWDPGTAPEMRWSFPVTSGRTVSVRLYFAEIYSGIFAGGQRVFDVSLEGSIPAEFNGIDAFATAGAKGAFMRSAVVTITDDLLDLEFLHRVENPALNAIEIIAFVDDGNAPPVVTNPGAQTHSEGSSISLQIVASDADGDTLNYSASGLPPGLSINSATGLISGTLAAGSAAGSPYSVSVSVSDGTDSRSVNFNWTVQSGSSNTPPTITAPANQTHAEGDAVTLQIVASDADGDTLSFSASGLPGGLSINASTGLISGTLAAGSASGSPYSVTVTVSDGIDTASAPFSWTISAGPGGSQTVLYRINVGGPQVAAADGSTPVWAVDTVASASPYRVAGGLPTASDSDGGSWGGPVNMSHPSLPSSAPSTLFQTERWDPVPLPEMRWEFPVAGGQQVEVRLYFAEIYSGVFSAGQRVFDASIEGSVPTAFTGIDPFAVTGIKGGFMRAATVTAVGPTLDIEFIHAMENPALKAIEIIALGAGGNSAPVVTNPGAQTGTEGSSVSLQITASDADGDTLSYGAGGLPPGLSINTATGLISGTLAAGSAVGSPYSVSVAVSDGQDSSDVGFSWTVQSVGSNTPPSVDNPGAQSGTENDAVSLQIVASDADGDALTYSANGLPGGLSINAVSGLISGTLAAGSAAGSPYSVSIAVSDGQDSSDVGFSWTVQPIDSNTPPSVENPGAQINTEGDAVTLQIVASDTDGDTLAYSASGLPDGLSINATTGVISGTLASGSATGSPYAVVVTVSDGIDTASTEFSWAVSAEPGTGSTVLYRINVGGSQVAAADGSAPVWSADTAINASPYRVGGGEGIASDTDGGAWGGPVNMTHPSLPASVPSTVFQTERWDPAALPEMRWEFPATSGQALEVRLYFAETYSGIFAAGQRVFDVSVEGSVPAAFSAIDPFAETGIKGGFMRSATVTVAGATLDLEFLHLIENPALKAIEILAIGVGGGNAPPTVTNPGDQTGTEGNSINLQIVAADADDDTLSYSATGLPPSLTIDASTGLISGPLATGSAAGSPYSVSVSVSDGQDSTDASFSWTVQAEASNTPPSVDNPGAQTGTEGDPVTLQIVASDADGDALSYGAGGLPPGLSINTATGLISGTLAADSAAGSPYSVSVAVSDGIASSEISFAWTVLPIDSNTPPAVENPGTQSNTEGESVSLQIVASDADGDTLAYSASGLPDGVSINTSTGLIAGTLAKGTADGSPYSVTVAVSDGAASSEIDFDWNVQAVDANTPPVIENPGTQSNTEGDVVSLPIIASDADGDALVFSASGLPGGLSIDAGTGLVSGTLAPNSASSSPYTVTVTVSDEIDSATTTFNWTVAGPAENIPPIALDDNATVVIGGNMNIDLLANDSDADGTLDPDSVEIVRNPRYGTLTNVGSGVWNYSHGGSRQPNDRFEYFVRDDQGAASNVATVRLKIVRQGTLTGSGRPGPSDPTGNDDDGDGWLDTEDPFPRDPDNGTSTALPVRLEFAADSFADGVFGLGFSGVMTDGIVGVSRGRDYFEMFNRDRVFVGNDPERPNLLTIAAVDSGDARGTGNDQTHAFQFGMDVDSTRPPIVISTIMHSPWFGGLSPDGNPSQGFYIGRGDQRNYLKLALDGSSNALELVLEQDDAVESWFLRAGDLLGAKSLTLVLVVDPQSGRAQAMAGIDDTDPVAVGEPITLPLRWFDPNDERGLAVGLIATSRGGHEFAAHWSLLAAEWLASDDIFEVLEDSKHAQLDVRASDAMARGFPIVAVTAGDSGGSVEINQTSARDAPALRYSPAADFAGIETFSYTVDGGIGIRAQAVVGVSVLPVNDPPEIELRGDVAVAIDAGPQRLPGFAHGFQPGGGADEARQQIAEFIVTTDASSRLFSAAPAIDRDGTLSFTPEPGQSGQVTVTVQVRDDGGTADGGQDLSKPRTFTLTVTPGDKVNHEG